MTDSISTIGVPRSPSDERQRIRPSVLGPGKDLHSELSEIYKYRAIGHALGTAGQPTEAQFETIRANGFEVVINLALPTSDNAISNEGSLVASLGMSYAHIPVDFKAPKERDFRTFCRVMDAFDDRPGFVHCAANLRVSAFVFLYRVLRQRVARTEAERDLHAIWEPDGAWSLFIEEQLKSHQAVRFWNDRIHRRAPQ